MTDEQMLKMVKRMLKQEINTLKERIDKIAAGIVEEANSQLNYDAHSNKDRPVDQVLTECFYDYFIQHYEDEKQEILSWY